MPITVDHGVGPVVPAAAYGMGLMRGQQRYGAQAAKYAQTFLDRKDRYNAFQQQRLDALYERDQQRQFTAGRDKFQAEVGRLDDQRTFANQRSLFDLQGNRYLEQEKIRGEYDIDQEVVQGLRNGELELPEAAMRQIRQLDAAAVEAEKLGPEQQAEFQMRAAAKRRALLRMAQPKTIPALSLDEQFNKDVYERDGRRFQYDRKTGQWDVLTEPGKETDPRDADMKRLQQDDAYDKMVDAATKRALEAEKEDGVYSPADYKSKRAEIEGRYPNPYLAKTAETVVGAASSSRTAETINPAAPEWAQQVIRNSQGRPDLFDNPTAKALLNKARQANGTATAAPAPMPTAAEAYTDVKPEYREMFAKVGTVQQQMRALQQQAGGDFQRLSAEDQKRYLALRKQLADLQNQAE